MMILTPVAPSGGTVSADHQQTDPFVATVGQTAFVLTQTPVSSADVQMKVNKLSYENGVDFTVSGTAVTWTDPFVLKAGDLVVFLYNF
jgi:hypothetical protein